MPEISDDWPEDHVSAVIDRSIMPELVSTRADSIPFRRPKPVESNKRKRCWTKEEQFYPRKFYQSLQDRFSNFGLNEGRKLRVQRRFVAKTKKVRTDDSMDYIESSSQTSSCYNSDSQTPKSASSDSESMESEDIDLQ